MPVKDYAAYAASDKGRAARAKARQNWVAKRKAEQSTKPGHNTKSVADLLKTWGST